MKVVQCERLFSNEWMNTLSFLLHSAGVFVMFHVSKVYLNTSWVHLNILNAIGQAIAQADGTLYGWEGGEGQSNISQ